MKIKIQINKKTTKVFFLKKQLQLSSHFIKYSSGLDIRQELDLLSNPIREESTYMILVL